MNAAPATTLVAVREVPPVGEHGRDTGYDLCDCGARVVTDPDGLVVDYTPGEDRDGVVHDCAGRAGSGAMDYDESELYPRPWDYVLHLAGETPHWPEDRDR